MKRTFWTLAVLLAAMMTSGLKVSGISAAGSALGMAFADEGERTGDGLSSPKYPMWSGGVKMGFWMPTAANTKKFFDNCCNIVVTIDGGFLYKGRYGVEGSIGFFDKDRPMVGAETGERASETFNLFLLPMQTNAVWRMDYMDRQWVVPYIKGGVNYVFYREGDPGRTIKGLKTGLHAAGGLQFLIPWTDGDQDLGMHDFFFIVEADYGWINSFGKKGLDLSGMTYSAGILLEF